METATLQNRSFQEFNSFCQIASGRAWRMETGITSVLLLSLFMNYFQFLFESNERNDSQSLL